MMYELACLFACFVVPLALLIAGAVWYGRQSSAARPAPDLLMSMHQRIEAWIREGRLSAADAAPVLRIVREDLQQRTAVAPAAIVATPQPPAMPVAAVAAQTRPAALPRVAPSSPSAQPTKPPSAKQPAGPSPAERLWAGLLALRTRQMLLFLGAFLLVISSLVLVVFNWENFPAVLQCGLLATVCAALWAGGELLDHRLSMPSAGAGLRAVAGVLAPIVGGAITRLLQFEPHPAWLIVSVVSVGLYTFAARRTNQRLFGFAAALAGASTVLAACGFVSWPALPAVLCSALVGYLALARLLRAQTPALAIGSEWTAHALVPAALLVAGALNQASLIGGMALGATLAAGAVFYATAALLDRRMIWSWPASILGPVAVFTVATELQPGRPVLWALALITTMALYLAGAWLLRTRKLATFALAPHAIAHVVVPVVLLGAVVSAFGTPDGSLVLWAGFLFYALALIFEPLPQWSVLAAFVVPLALVSTCFANGLTGREPIEGILLGLASGYLLFAQVFRRGIRAVLAIGPLLLAHTLVPLIVANVLLAPIVVWSSALLLWAALGFYLLVLGLERRAIWLWPVLALLPLAVVASASIVQLDPAAMWAIVSVLVLGYFGYGVAIEPRTQSFSLPGYVLGGLLGLITGAGALLNGTAALQWSLPALILACLLVVGATHRSWLTWLGQRVIEPLASAIVGLATLLLAGWLWVTLETWLPATAWRAVVLLPLAALLFIGAQFWPGRLRIGYGLALRAVATMLGPVFALLSFANPDAGVVGFALLAAVWASQLVWQRNGVWATLALATGAYAFDLWLDRMQVSDAVWMFATLGIAAFYTLGAARARATTWQCLVVPGTAIGAFAGVLTLLVALDTSGHGAVEPAQVVAVLGLVALVAAHSAIWRQPWLGYISGPLFALAVLLAASRGFFLAAAPQVADYAYTLCGLAVGFLALGEGLRRYVGRFAQPYEQLGFAVVLGALPLAGFEPQHAAIAWLVASSLGLYATFRHRLAWVILPALLAADAALVFGAAWLVPGGELSGAGLLLVGAAWVQAGLAFGSRRFWPALRPFAYLATAVSGVVGLGFVASGLVVGSAVYAPTMQAAFGLAALLAILASAERRKEVAWGALGLLALGFSCWHTIVELPLVWNVAYGVAELLALCLVGWALELLEQRRSVWSAALAVWRRVLCEGVLGMGWLLAALTAVFALFDAAPQPLVFALIMLALLLATVAVRRRRIELGYLAGGAMLAAALVQLFQIGVREPQGYALPAGVYLLALADGLRRFQDRRQVARLLECAAVALMLGTAATQAIQTDGTRGLVLTLALCAISFLVLGYGVVRRLQVPFAGGAAGFVFGVLWLTVDPLRATNSWVMLGLLGLGLVGLYVLLERRQEQLVRAGRVLIERWSAWG